MYRTGLLIVSCAVLLLGVVGMSRSVAAQTVQEGQLQPDDAVLYDPVAMDCLDVKFKLGEVHRTDRLLRVTLGEAYDNVSSNLMGHFNARIVQNRLDGSELIKIAAEFESAHATFRENYTAYDDAMLDILKTNCQSRTQSYYLELQETKALRGVVHDSVQELDDLMQSYHEAFKDFRKDIDQNDEESQE